MTLDEIIRKRKSVRNFAETPVTDEELGAILEAGRLAPSARNIQNWHFTAVRNAGLIQKLQQAAGGQKQVGGAPVCLVVWAGEDRTMACGQSAASVDCSIALSFMMLKATELGIGSCWLGHFDADAVKEVLQLPQNAVVVAMTPLGHTDAWPEGPGRKNSSEVIDIRG